MGRLFNNLNLKKKKVALYTLIPAATLFLSGCMRLDSNGNPSGWMSELIYNYLVVPFDSFLHYLANNFGSYAIALIILTIITRIIIIPLSLKQQKSMIESQVKMEHMKPITDKIQKMMNETNDPQQKQSLQLELAKIYQQYGIGIGNQLVGCLPLFIQMPIFVAILHVINNSKEIASATFLGIELGKRSVIIAVLVGIIYYLQSKITAATMSKEQQQMNNSMALTMPIMFLFISLSGPAGVALYWLVGGIIGIIQQVIINNYYRPKVQAEVEAKYKDMNVEIPDFVANYQENKKIKPAQKKPTNKNRRRNEGIQQRKRNK